MDGAVFSLSESDAGVVNGQLSKMDAARKVADDCEKRVQGMLQLLKAQYGVPDAADYDIARAAFVVREGSGGAKRVEGGTKGEV